MNILKNKLTVIFLKCLVRPGGGNLRAQSAVMRIFGDVKFVSNIFHIPLTLWKVSKDSEMVMHLGG